MANIKQRIEALEMKISVNKSALVLFIDNKATPEQQYQIDEAEASGREVILVSFTSPN